MCSWVTAQLFGPQLSGDKQSTFSVTGFLSRRRVNLSLAHGSNRGRSRVQGFLVPSSKKLERWRTKTAVIQGAEEKQIISAPGLAAQLSLLQVNAELVFSVPTESLDH